MGPRKENAGEILGKPGIKNQEARAVFIPQLHPDRAENRLKDTRWRVRTRAL